MDDRVSRQSTAITSAPPSLAHGRALLPVDAALGSPSWPFTLMRIMPEALIVTDAQGQVSFLNGHAERLLGVTAHWAIGRHWTQLLHLRLANGDGQTVPDPAAIERRDLDPLRRLLEAQRLVLGSASDGASQVTLDRAPAYHLTRRDGLPRRVQVCITALEEVPECALNGYLIVLGDRTREHLRLSQLAHQNMHDHLTNLVRRGEFERRATHAVHSARRDQVTHVLLFMDLDRFKQVNDHHGHQAGDAVLRQVAETLRRSVRARDTLARLGGDEFALLMERCPVSEGLRAAKVLMQRLRRHPPRWQGQPYDIGISIGLTAIDATSEGLEQVMARADAACYQAKKIGGNQCVVAPPAPARPTSTEGCNSMMLSGQRA